MKRKKLEALAKQATIDIANSEDINVWDRMEDYYLNRWYIKLFYRVFGVPHPLEVQYRYYQEYFKSQTHQQEKLDDWFVRREMDSLDYHYPSNVYRFVNKLSPTYKFNVGCYDVHGMPQECAPTITYREPVACAEVPLWYQIYLKRGLII